MIQFNLGPRGLVPVVWTEVAIPDSVRGHSQPITQGPYRAGRATHRNQCVSEEGLTVWPVSIDS